MITVDVDTLDQEFLDQINANFQALATFDAVTGKVYHAADYPGYFSNGIDDCTDALLAALDDANASGGTVIVPPGTFLVTQRLSLSGEGARLYGAGRRTVFKVTDNAIGTLFDLTGDGAEVHNFMVDGTSIGSPTFTGLKFNAGDLRASRVWVKGAGKGIYMPQGNACWYSDLRLEACPTCIHSGGVSGVYPGDTTWRDIVMLPVLVTGYGWIIDGNTNAQRAHHILVAGGLNAVLVRGDISGGYAGGDILPDGIEVDDSSNFTQTTGSVIKLKKVQNFILGSLAVVGGSTAGCGVEIDANADGDIDGVLISDGAEIRANFQEGIRWTRGANVAVMSSFVYANSDGNVTMGTATCSNIFIGADAKGKFQAVANMLGASNGPYTYANIAGAAKHAIEFEAGALSDDSTNHFPGSAFVVGNDMRGCNVSSMAGWDDISPTGRAKRKGLNLLDDADADTWTPVLKFGGATTGIAFVTPPTAIYQQIDNVIYFEAYLHLSSKGSASGNATIEGLPFANGSYAGAVTLPYYGNMASLSAPAGYVDAGISRIVLTNGGATSHVVMTDGNFTDTSELFISGSYSL